MKKYPKISDSRSEKSHKSSKSSSSKTSKSSNSSGSSDKKNDKKKKKKFQQRSEADFPMDENLRGTSYELYYHCYHGNVKELKELIKKGLNLNIYEENHYTPLHLCCMNGHLDCLDLLLKERHISLNVSDKKGKTPLFLACQRGHTKIVVKLLKNGAITNHKDMKGRNAVDVSNPAIKKLLSDQICKERYFFQAVKGRRINDVKKLVKQININCENEEGKTPLDVAIKVIKNLEIIKLLITSGAIIDQKTVEGRISGNYKRYLGIKLQEQKKEGVVSELYQTETIYLDDLRIIKNYFVKPLLGKNYLLKKKIKNNDWRKAVEELFEHLKHVTSSSVKLVKNWRILFPRDGASDHAKFLNYLGEFDYDNYAQLIKKQTLLESLIKNEKGLKDFFKFLQEKEKTVPYPRIKDFFSLLSKPRLRIIKYKDSLKRMLRYSPKRSVLFGLVNSSLKKIETRIYSIDFDADIIEKRKIVFLLGERFKKKYSFKNLLQNKSRSLVCYCEGAEIRNWGEKNSKKTDVYLFSDCLIFVESKLTIYVFADTKVIVTVNADHVRIVVYKSREKIIDCIVYINQKYISQKWARDIKRHFYSDNPFLYSSKVLLISHLEDEEDVETFLDFCTNDPSFVSENFEKKIEKTEEYCNELKEKVRYLTKNKMKLEGLSGSSEDRVAMEEGKDLGKQSPIIIKKNLI